MFWLALLKNNSPNICLVKYLRDTSTNACIFWSLGWKHISRSNLIKSSNQGCRIDKPRKHAAVLDCMSRIMISRRIPTSCWFMLIGQKNNDCFDSTELPILLATSFDPLDHPWCALITFSWKPSQCQSFPHPGRGWSWAGLGCESGATYPKDRSLLYG